MTAPRDPVQDEIAALRENGYFGRMTRGGATKGKSLTQRIEANPLWRLAYRPDEVALLFGVSRDTIDRIIKAGRLESIKVENVRLIPRHSLRRFLRGSVSK